MECPKCKAAMEQVTIGNVEVDRCTKCQGLWFDAGEIDSLKQLKGSEKLDAGSAHAGKEMNKIDHIECPRCHEPMIRMVDVDQHHIWFESCPVCKGAFLDAGEFRDLKKYTIADYIKGLFTRERK